MGKLSFETPIIGANGATVGDLWTWAYSDLLSNATRGVLAEFLVGSALDVTESARVEWNAYDLLYREQRIEVKSAAYCQSWSQSTLSRIQFDIAEKLGWDASTNTYLSEKVRSADCYVFCLFNEMDRTKARQNLLDVTFWEFYVVSTTKLNTKFGKQTSIGLNRLKNTCSDPRRLDTGLKEVSYVQEGENRCERDGSSQASSRAGWCWKY